MSDLPNDDALGVRVVLANDGEGYWTQIRDVHNVWHYAVFSHHLDFVKCDFAYARAILLLRGAPDAVRGDPTLRRPVILNNGNNCPHGVQRNMYCHACAVADKPFFATASDSGFGTRSGLEGGPPLPSKVFSNLSPSQQAAITQAADEEATAEAEKAADEIGAGIIDDER